MYSAFSNITIFSVTQLLIIINCVTGELKSVIILGHSGATNVCKVSLFPRHVVLSLVATLANNWYRLIGGSIEGLLLFVKCGRQRRLPSFRKDLGSKTPYLQSWPMDLEYTRTICDRSFV